jgi:apolipoprotein N-acyltransferase
MTLLASVLFPLALPNELFPTGNAVIGIIALSPLYIAVLRAQTTREAALVGVIFGGISTFLANYWLMFFGDYSVWTIGGTTLGYILFNAILVPFLWRALRTARVYRPFLFASVWTSYELLKSVGFLGYPWGLAAYPYNTIPAAIQIADVTGVWGISFVAVLLSATVAEFALDAVHGTDWKDTARVAAVLVVLLAITTGYGAAALRREIPRDGTVDVVLVQQNSDSWNVRDIAGPLATAQRITLEGIEAADSTPDLVVWSETSLRYPYAEFRRWYEQNPANQTFVEFVSNLPAPLLTGAPFRPAAGEFTIHKAAILLGPDARVEQWYGKQQLVPFAEYVPFWERPAVQRLFQEVIGISAIWAPGPGYRTFEISRKSGDPVVIGTPICFEDGFAYVTRRFVRAGVDLFINLTNNSWSLTDSAQLQHLVAARFRAVETRRSLVRSTNAGFTGVLDPWGQVVSSVPMFTEAHLFVTVPVYKPAGLTVYMRWGEYFPVALILMLLVLLFVSEIRSWRHPEPGALPTS